MTTSTIERNPLTTLTDDELIARIESGEVEFSLLTLRRRYGRMVQQLATKIVQDAHVAEDVTQEVFSKVFFKSHQYQQGTNFRAWLLGITRNQALTVLRREKHSARAIGSLHFNSKCEDVDGEILLDAGYEDRSLEEREFMAAFEDAVDSLPERYRSVFRACVMENKPYAEVAEAMDVPVGTVAIRIMRARQRLYRALESNFDRVRRLPACLQ